MARVLTFILGVALGAAAGVAVGITIGGGPGPESDDLDGVLSAPAAPGSDAPGGTPHDRREGQRPRRAAGDFLASIDVGDLVPIQRGTGVITGRVFDAKGRGIAGVKVTARPQDEAPKLDLAPTDDDEERLRRELRERVRQFRWNEALSRRSVTDATGAFRCEGLSDRAYWIYVDHPGWEFDRAGGGNFWDDIRPGADVDVVGTVRNDLTVEVTMPDGRAAEKADIVRWLRGQQVNSSSSNWSPSDASIRLRPGEWRVRAEGGEQDEYRSDETGVTIVDGAATPTLRLRFKERRGVLVELGPAGPDGPTRVGIQLRRASADAAASASTERDENDSDTRHANPGGRAALLDVAPGAYSLVATNACGREFHRETVTVGDGLVRRTVAIPAGDLRDWFLVRVVGPGDAVVPDCDFQSVARRRGDEATNSLAWSRTRDGRVKVALPEPGELGDDTPDAEHPRTLTLRVSSDEFGSVEIPWEPTPGREYSVEFTAPAQLEVTAPEAPPGAQLIVRVRRATDDDSNGWNREIRDGSATVAPLPVGDIWVDLVLQDRNYHQNRISRTPLALHAGPNQVALTLPRLQALRVHAPESISPGGISLYLANGDGTREWWSDGETSEGAKTWDLLPAGSYVLHHDEFGEMTVQVPCPADVTFVAKPWNAVRFDVDHDSDIARAGLRDGDIGVAIDGTDFETPKQIYALFQAGSLKARSRITVLRGTQRLDVEIDLSKLGDDLRWDNAVR